MTTKQIVIAVAAAGLLYWLYKKHSTIMVVAPAIAPATTTTDTTSGADGYMNLTTSPGATASDQLTAAKNQCEALGGSWNGSFCVRPKTTSKQMVMPMSKHASVGLVTPKKGISAL